MNVVICITVSSFVVSHGTSRLSVTLVLKQFYSPLWKFPYKIKTLTKSVDS